MPYVKRNNEGEIIASYAVKQADATEFVSDADLVGVSEKITGFTEAIQRELDAQARALGYDSIISAITYADEPQNTSFQNEGKAFRKWRSEVWTYGYNLLGQWQAGNIPEPTEAEVITGLPALVLP